MTSIRNAADWSAAWAKSGPIQNYITQPSDLLPLLDRFLPQADPGSPLDFLEIGCYPGRHLYLFARQFGYRVHGIDFVPEAAEIPGWLSALGVEAKVTVADLFSFHPGQLYDVVASFGFVEHFQNWKLALDKHLALLAPGGYLFIKFPNFRYGQYYLRKFLNPSFLEGHFLDCMNLEDWHKALLERNMKILYLDYFFTFRIWSALAGHALARWGRKMTLKLLRKTQKTIEKLKIDYPNRYFSPFAIIIAQRGQ